MAENDGNGDAGVGGAPQTPAKPKKAPEAEKLKDEPRFRVKLLTNAIIDGETHKAGQVIEVTGAQANWLERSGTIPPDD